MSDENTQSGHVWDRTGERCSLCGDKDWMADRYCSGNAMVRESRRRWLEERQEPNIKHVAFEDWSPGVTPEQMAETRAKVDEMFRSMRDREQDDE